MKEKENDCIHPCVCESNSDCVLVYSVCVPVTKKEREMQFDMCLFDR